MDDKALVIFFGDNTNSWVKIKQLRAFSVQTAEKCKEICKNTNSPLLIKLEESITVAIEDKKKNKDESDNEDICFVCLKDGQLILCDT